MNHYRASIAVVVAFMCTSVAAIETEIIALPDTSVTNPEKLIPFFPNQDILTIDKKYAEKMSFFTEYDDFVEAQMYEMSEGEYALELFYEVNDTLFKERRVMSGEERIEYLNGLLRRYVAENESESESERERERDGEQGRQGAEGTERSGDLARESEGDDAATALIDVDLLSQEGRTAMLVMNTISGLGFYGYALPITLQTEDDKAIVGLYMLASGASFYIPYRITERKNVSLAQASLNFYGNSRGVMHGIFLGEVLSDRPDWDDYFTDDPNNGFYTYNYDRAQEEYDRARDDHTSVLFGMGIVTSIAGGIAGYKLAERWEYDGGSTSILQMWGDFGTISGLLLADVFDFYERPELDATFATALGMSALGMTGGKLFFGDTRDYTLGDAIVYRSTVTMTTLPLFTLVDYFNPNNETAYAVAGLAGIAAGGYLGWRATLNKDFNTGDGVYVALGELAGGLVGLGIGYLVSVDMESSFLLTTATIGAAAGYGLMYSRLAQKSVNLSAHLGVPSLKRNERHTLARRQAFGPRTSGYAHSSFTVDGLHATGTGGTQFNFAQLPGQSRSPDIDFRINPAGMMMNMLDVDVSPALSGAYSAASLSVRW